MKIYCLLSQRDVFIYRLNILTSFRKHNVQTPVYGGYLSSYKFYSCGDQSHQSDGLKRLLRYSYRFGASYEQSTDLATNKISMKCFMFVYYLQSQAIKHQEPFTFYQGKFYKDLVLYCALCYIGLVLKILYTINLKPKHGLFVQHNC